MDPEVLFDYCSVPFCPTQILKALDFSLDNDQNLDENKSYTHASLKKENLPASFTICTAFMVERWSEFENAMLFALNYEEGYEWHWVKIFADETYTQFSFFFDDLPKFSVQSEILFYPLQWTRVCLSLDSNNSAVKLVVDGELLVEETLEVKEYRPDNLNLELGKPLSS